MFPDDITDEALREIVENRPSQKVSLELNEQARRDGELDVLRQKALDLLWKRHLTRSDQLSDEDVDELLEMPIYSTAMSMLGEAAGLDMLDPSQVERACIRLANSEPKSKADWSYRQLVNRRLVTQLIDLLEQADALSNHEELEARKKTVIHDLMQRRQEWPVLWVIPHMEEAEVNEVESLLVSECGFTRHGRHCVREALRVQRKNLKS